MMNHSQPILPLRMALVCVAFFLLCAPAWTQTEKVLHSFSYGTGDGFNPEGALLFDSQGNLYGTTNWGGVDPSTQACACGTVFQLKPNQDGSWTENIIHSFVLDDNGAYPLGPVIFDTQGNLYGVAQGGGSQRDGVVFELTPGSNGSWTESVVHTFGGADGAGPNGGLLQDAAGRLYGTTSAGGEDDVGVAFSILPGYGSGEIVLHMFTGRGDGNNPQGTLISDASGNLYGTAMGGPDNGGLVFRLTPTGTTGWTKTLVYPFSDLGTNGMNPSGLVFGPDGNLYGTGGGGLYQYGVIFSLTANADGWSEKVIYNFKGPPSDGANPVGPVRFDQAGNLYGATGIGGSTNWGTVFKLTPSSEGEWREEILYTFSGGSDGANPSSGVILDEAGNL
jgi:uncharacterized repeat protein (TIGR03803 family)